MYICLWAALTSDSASSINTASLYDYLKLFWNVIHSFSIKTDKIIDVCGFIWAVAIILKNNSLQQHIEKK